MLSLLVALQHKHSGDSRSQRSLFSYVINVNILVSRKLCICPSSPDKNKPSDSEEESPGVNGGGPGGAGGVPASGALRPNSQSAFLGPLLWERTLPCDGGLFQLQYMDLEEFLTENGMGMHGNGASSASAQIPSQVKTNGFTNFASTCVVE